MFTYDQAVQVIELGVIAVSVAGVAGKGVIALGAYTHNKRLDQIGLGITDASLQINKALTQLIPGVDVNAYKDAKVAEWTGKIIARNPGAVSKTGMTADVLASKIDSAVHSLDVSTPTALTASVTEDVAHAKAAATGALAAAAGTAAAVEEIKAQVAAILPPAPAVAPVPVADPLAPAPA